MSNNVPWENVRNTIVFFGAGIAVVSVIIGLGLGFLIWG